MSAPVHRSSLRAAACAAALAGALALGGAASAATPTPRADDSARNSPMASTLPSLTQAAPPETASTVTHIAAPVLDPVSPVLDIIAPVASSDGAVSTSRVGNTTTATLSNDVTFDVDSATLTTRATQVLDSIVTGWAGKAPAEVTVVGHTDSVADEAHNQALSEQRAQAVADYLTSKSPGLKVKASGKGETEPAASETKEDGSVSEEGRAANRRVVLTWQQ
ncbi:OmpA family protein [Actinomyces timonensis]|uniref:OmpA family protein n=1 Tax=Actinomyces timonensis TaxID=1288391 RepID=A0AAU8N0Y6_9ACTO